MRITDLAVTRYAQSKAADGSPASAEIQIVDVVTDEGVSGRGFLTASNSTTSPNADLYATLLRRNLRNIILRQDPVLTDQLWHRMYDQITGRRGARGLILNAIAAIDFACWDIKAKAMDRPLGDLFGARRGAHPHLRQRGSSELA
jgi:L-alanine-DL-glutamate epimerase-like enolase superfamily enzyme